MFFLVGGFSFQLLLVVVLLVGTYLVFPLSYLACSFLYHYFVLHHYLHQKFYSVFPLVVPVYYHLSLGFERPCCLSYHGCVPELICKVYCYITASIFNQDLLSILVQHFSGTSPLSFTNTFKVNTITSDIFSISTCSHIVVQGPVYFFFVSNS